MRFLAKKGMTSLLKRFLSYYKPHRLVFTLDMLASFTVSMIGIFYPILTRSMVGEFTSGGRDYKIIVGGGIGLLLLYVIRMMLNYFIQYQGHVMGVKMQAQMRREMFDHYPCRDRWCCYLRKLRERRSSS